MKKGFTLLNDGETALVVPLTPSRQSAFGKDYWRAHIVRREGMTQEAFMKRIASWMGRRNS
jgi:hypothetical protein